MRKTSIILFWLAAFVSCKNSSTTENAIETKKINWEILKVKVDNQNIYISSDNDTCNLYKYFKEDTVYIKLHNQYRSEKKQFILSKVDRDSLFLLAEDAITNPVYSNQFVTDYAGEFVSLSLEYGNTTIICEYSSVNSWSSISPTFHKIYLKTFVEMHKQLK